MYDVTEHDTFEHLPSWLEDVREQAEENASIALVGNMADRPVHNVLYQKRKAERLLNSISKYILLTAKLVIFRDKC